MEQIARVVHSDFDTITVDMKHVSVDGKPQYQSFLNVKKVKIVEKQNYFNAIYESGGLGELVLGCSLIFCPWRQNKV